MAGGLNAHTNPFVEAWGFKREHIEKTFRFTPKALGIIAVTGVLFPLWVYKVSIREFVRARQARRARGQRGGRWQPAAGGATLGALSAAARRRSVRGRGCARAPRVRLRASPDFHAPLRRRAAPRCVCVVAGQERQEAGQAPEAVHVSGAWRFAPRGCALGAPAPSGVRARAAPRLLTAGPAAGRACCAAAAPADSRGADSARGVFG
jgi:hypothetical protein